MRTTYLTTLPTLTGSTRLRGAEAVPGTTWPTRLSNPVGSSPITMRGAQRTS